ncbi:MAG: sporulation protein YqfD [Lachnospiraceae bacterium]|nr:sporulation protein YqfD [Lachnospiraceae bacterium]
MEQQVVNYLHGYVRVRISGTSCERFWNLCAYHGIRIWNLLPVCSSGYDAYEASILRSDFFRLKTIVKKSHTRIRVTKRYGLPFFIHRYRRRWACVLGALAACLFMAWLSAHIWNISIEGNLSESDDVIFEYLEKEGISQGIWRNQVDTQELSDQLRNYFSRFSWVSAELKGTRLVIYVKEGIADDNIEASEDPVVEGTDHLTDGMADAGSEKNSQESVSGNAEENMEVWDTATGIAAAKSGVVVSIFVRKGLADVAVGDEVVAGDLLVSGQIPVHNDDGDVISWQYVAADADVVLRTETDYYDAQDYETVLKQYTGQEEIRYGLRVGSLLFALPGVWVPFSQADYTGEIFQVKLSDNFYLPIYYYKYTAREYENLQYTYSKEQASAILESNLSGFMEKLEEKWGQIFLNDVTKYLYENTAVASGVLITDESAVVRTEENIGKQQEEDPQE